MKRQPRELNMRKRTAATKNVIILLCLALCSQQALSFSISNSPSRGGGDGEEGGGAGAGGSFQNESARVRSCEEYVGTPWGNMFGENAENPSYLNTFAGQEGQLVNPNGAFISGLKQNCSQTSGGTPQQQGGEGQAASFPVSDASVQCLARHISHLVNCEAYGRSLQVSNYTRDLDEFDERETSPSMSANGLECLNQPDQSSQQQCLTQAQSQEPLSCVNEGPETHDFLACKRILTFIDGFAIGKQVMQMQQGFRAGAHQLDLQSEYMQRVQTGEAGTTDALAIQRDTLEKQGNLAYEMAAFDAARAGVLLGMLASAPRPGKFITDRCEPNFDTAAASTTMGQIINAVITGIGASDPEALRTQLSAKLSSFGMVSLDGTINAPNGKTDVCRTAIHTENGRNYIFMPQNQEVFDRVKGIAIRAGLEALANGAKGALLHDQANMVDDAMKSIEEFEPPEFPVAEAPEATASECLVDPNAEGCVAPNGAGFEGFRDQGFSATMGGSANLGTTGQRGTLDDDETNVNGAAGPDRDLIPDEFGIVRAPNQQNSDFADGKARAGSIKAGELAAGGGAAGGGAGGGGGGLGGGPERAPAEKKQPSGKKDIHIKTSGNGLATVGGRGRIGAAKKDKAANPFSKLLGKNKGAGNKTLNFRGPAQLGSQKGSLFQMISNRYNVVQSKDRLLKYEADRGQ
jgi:hypothetical protein